MFQGIPPVDPRVLDIQDGSEWVNEMGQRAVVKGITVNVHIEFPNADNSKGFRLNDRCVPLHHFLEQFTEGN